MFFPLSKIIGAFISPLNLICLFLVIGGLLLAFKKKAGRSYIFVAAVLFILFGIFPTGTNMMVMLERHYDRPAIMPDWINNVLVLGGTFESDISSARGVPVLNETAERVIETTALMERYPYAIIIFSGGNGHLWDRERQAETDDMAFYLDHIGVPDDNVLYESESRNTYENIKFSRNLFTPVPYETWVIVTSAYHMPRTMGVIRTLNWPGQIIPYPTDYRTTGRISWIPRPELVLNNLHNADIALHEYAGLLAYQLTGKISYPFNDIDIIQDIADE